MSSSSSLTQAFAKELPSHWGEGFKVYLIENFDLEFVRKVASWDLEFRLASVPLQVAGQTGLSVGANYVSETRLRHKLSAEIREPAKRLSMPTKLFR